ncbi:MAG: VOC family protein [Psychrobium sp.]|nr:VOC family protein [Psychrobium sp.]
MLPIAPLVWAEIAVADMERAINFYQTHFAVSFKRETIQDIEMAILETSSQEDAGVALVKHQMMQPSMNGSTIYLHLSETLSPLISKLEQAGIEILMPAFAINDGECGYSALFADSEGNKVGLWAKSL